MVPHLIHPIYLTDSWNRVAFLLTFIASVLLPFSTSYAFDDKIDPTAPPTVSSGQPIYTSPFDEGDQHRRVGLLLDYIKKTGPSWAPGLPAMLFDPPNWAANAMKAAKDQLSLSLDASDNEGGTLPEAIRRPASSLLQAPTLDDAEAVWLTQSYHRKDVLPFNDAMIMGLTGRHEMFGSRLRLEAHPYYAQSWCQPVGYWGGEFSLSLSKSPDAKEGAASWGKITIGYTGGNNALMDNGHGFDLHSEIRFEEHLTLNAGVHQSEDSDFGDYVMLRWRLPIGN